MRPRGHCQPANAENQGGGAGPHFGWEDKTSPADTLWPEAARLMFVQAYLPKIIRPLINMKVIKPYAPRRLSSRDSVGHRGLMWGWYGPSSAQV
ncbi:MAG: hypothetical protein ACJARE_002699 [Paracoccaceae bacterium]|jgi:hypothetical protein